MNEIISEQKSHILRPIAMIFYFMVCAFTMSIVEVIVHDKVPGMKIALLFLQFYKLIFSEQATTKPLDDIAWYITSKAPFNTEYGIVEFFDFTEYVMSSLTIIGELLSVAGIAERADRVVGDREGWFFVRI